MNTEQNRATVAQVPTSVIKDRVPCANPKCRKRTVSYLGRFCSWECTMATTHDAPSWPVPDLRLKTS